jgi:hypothetical protein
MVLSSRVRSLIFSAVFLLAFSSVVLPIYFVHVAHAQESEGDAQGTGGTGAGSGGVSDVNDGTSGSSSPSNDFLTVTTSCNANGTANATISYFYGLYPPYHVLSMQILKDGVVVHSLGAYGVTNPEGITSLYMHQPGISFTKFAATSTYEVQVGDLAADFINTDTGPEINRWNFSQVASRTFGPLTCPAPDLVGYQTAIYGYLVNDSRKVTPGALQFNSGVGNQGNAWSGPFNVQVEVKNAPGTADYSKWSSKFRSSGFGSYTNNWLAPIAFDGSALVPGGSYLARVCVDVDKEVLESNGNNNCGEWDSFYVFAAVTTCPAGQLGTYPNCVTPTCAAGQTGTYPNCVTTPTATSPDLTVSGITPTSAIAGTATTFSATVTNTGGGSTGIGFKNFYQVKSGTVGYTPQNFFTKLFNIAHAAETITDLAATTMSALAAGGNGTATQTYTFPAAGTYGIRVCADKENSAGTNGNPNGLIAESDETNNCGGWTNVNVTSLCTPSCGSGSVCSSGACVLVGGPCTPTNACGQSNSGTYNSAGVCSVSAPAMPSNYGNSCPSVPATNACGMPGSGTILCNGSCSATTPPDTLCLPTVTLSADPTRVRKNTSTKLTWTSSAATSCTLTGQNGFSSTALLGTAVDSTPLDAQTTFTLTCSNAYGSKSASVIVNLIPSYIEV